MKRSVFWLFKTSFLLLIGVFLGACANVISTQPQGKELDSAVSQRDLTQVLKLVDKPRQYKPKDRLLYYLDAGLLHHYNGDFERSNELLELAEEAIVENQSKSLSRAAASLLLNDNALEYAGEDYEDIYINVFKALNYIQMNDVAAARVEIRRVDDKLSYLEEKYAKLAKELSKDPNIKTEVKPGKNHFHASALARYLSLLIYFSEGSYDSARIDYDNITFAYQSQPELYPFPLPPIRHPQQRGQAPILHVISFTNRGPNKTANALHVRSAKDMVLIGSKADDFSLYSFFWPGIEPDYYFKLSLPQIQVRPKRVAQVIAKTEDGKSYPLHKMEDIGLTAQHSFQLKESLVLIKSLSRSIMKGLAAQKAKEQATQKGSSLAASLFSFGTDLALFVSENADLRISQYWPAEAMIAEIPLPEGEQILHLEYYNKQGQLIFKDTQDIRIQAGTLNLVESWCF